jgi:hypothetical protein
VLDEMLESLAFRLWEVDSDAMPVVPGVAAATAEPDDVVLSSKNLIAAICIIGEDGSRPDSLPMLASIPSTQNQTETRNTLEM